MIVLDTSGLWAAIDADQPQHVATKRVLLRDSGPFLLSPFVLAELDYLLLTRQGIDRECDFLRDVAAGAYELVPITNEDVGRTLFVVEQYRDLAVGVTDASVALLAAKYRTTRLLTLDQRHFRSMKPLWGDTFTILPADEPN
ncbi:PIN domain-containing protein [Sphaerisporangium sp. NPDC051017]|uniref:PIN domain-containing protein n=1 Tax=Sphaerisporangium sp. NPDC051017 TaxID=3154636 RepID=UPI0034430698